MKRIHFECWAVSCQNCPRQFPSFVCFLYRDKPRVCTPAKNVSTFEINIFYYFLFMGPTLGFDTKQRNSFLMFFYNKSKILSILFIVKYEKNHTFWSVFSVVGAHNLHVQMRKRNKIKTLKHTHSSLISMAQAHGAYGVTWMQAYFIVWKI